MTEAWGWCEGCAVAAGTRNCASLVEASSASSMPRGGIMASGLWRILSGATYHGASRRNLFTLIFMPGWASRNMRWSSLNVCWRMCRACSMVTPSTV